MLWDTGVWECKDSNIDAAYKNGNLTFLLKGKKLKGGWKLIRFKNDRKNWLFIKEDDKYAKLEDEYNILEEKPKSVKSHRSLATITNSHGKATKKLNFPSKKSIKKNNGEINISIKKMEKSLMPTVIHPELAILVDKPLMGNKWLHEIKFDGYRIISFIKNKKIKLMTRNQHDWTKKFPYLSKEILKLNLKTGILDGELVALGADHHSDFQKLQNSIHIKIHPLLFIMFLI